MKRLLVLLLLLVTACAPATQSPTVAPTSVEATNDLESNVDILANLPGVDCNAGSTPADQEGSHFKADLPETTLFFSEGMQGKKLILAGTVVTAECFPVPRLSLDFWQADANGKYDDAGYTLRGHQSTDNKGRYYLETVYPGIDPETSTRSIHVKVQSPSGYPLITQFYFPDQPVDGQTVQLEDHGDFYLAYFNIILP